VAILMTMSRTPSVPVELKVGPFTPAEAADVGVSRNQLRGALYRRLGPGLYRWKGLVESPQLKLAAVARRLPAGAAFSGLTAAWLHGLDVIPDAPIEVTIPDSLGGGRLAGVHVRRGALIGRDIVVRRGLATTSALRTVADLGGRDPLTEGVVAADLFLQAGLVSKPELAPCRRASRSQGHRQAAARRGSRRAEGRVGDGVPTPDAARARRVAAARGAGRHP